MNNLKEVKEVKATLKNVSIKILNFFKEEVIIKGLININEYANEETSFKLYDNDYDFYIINFNEVKEIKF